MTCACRSATASARKAWALPTRCSSSRRGARGRGRRRGDARHHLQVHAYPAEEVSFRSLLVANRGEIALRIMRTAKRMGLRTIAVYSDADREAPHVRAADAAFHIGGSSPRESYLSIPAVLGGGGEAGQPGYGF